VDIAGSTATASPIYREMLRQRITWVPVKKLTEFLPEALWAEMIECVVGSLSACHRCPKVESDPTSNRTFDE